MNRFMKVAFAAGLSIAAFTSNAAGVYSYGSTPADVCRGHVTQDAAGNRLHYRANALTAPSNVQGRTLVYLNAKVRVDGALAERRVQCEVSNLHRKVLIASVANGRFVRDRTS